MFRRIALLTILTLISTQASAFDVYENSDIARERMKRIHTAICIFENDNVGPLTAPHLLYPQYINDPLIFWHPGDSDPPPTTIDNSIPNAPNSAQISFTIDDLDCDTNGWTEFIIRDNSAENNEGLFINLIDCAGPWTEPPLATPTPTRVTIARRHLAGLAIGMHIYANENSERLPNNLRNLWLSSSCKPREMWNPGDSDPMPTAIVDNHPDGPESAQISFEYFGAGLLVYQATPEHVLIRDNTPDNNEGYGRLEFRGDFKVHFDPLHDVGDPDGNCHRDLADWSVGAACLQDPEQLIEQPVCYLFEWTDDHAVDLRDIATGFNEFTGVHNLIHECSP